MKQLKVENSYLLGEKFSSTSSEALWDIVVNYIKNNNHNNAKNLKFDKNNLKIDFSIFDETKLFDIIKSFSIPENKLINEKYLVRTIKLKVKFDKETKTIELIEDENLNTVTYNISNNKIDDNSLFFSNESLIKNYENLNDIKENPLRLSILFFNEYLNNELVGEKYICLPFNIDEIKFDQTNLTDCGNFNYNKFIDDFNNGIIDDNYILNNENYYYKNYKLVVTEIRLIDNTENSILLFKNSLNKYIFDEFVENEKNKIL